MRIRHYKSVIDKLGNSQLPKYGILGLKFKKALEEVKIKIIL